MDSSQIRVVDKTKIRLAGVFLMLAPKGIHVFHSRTRGCHHHPLPCDVLVGIVRYSKAPLQEALLWAASTFKLVDEKVTPDLGVSCLLMSTVPFFEGCA